MHDLWRRVVLEKAERSCMSVSSTRLSVLALLVFCVVLLVLALGFAESSALILRGVAGDPEHEQKFEKWTAGTSKALVDKFGFAADHVIVLTGQKTAQAEIQKAFATLKQQLKPGDSFFLF